MVLYFPAEQELVVEILFLISDKLQKILFGLILIFSLCSKMLRLLGIKNALDLLVTKRLRYNNFFLFCFCQRFILFIFKGQFFIRFSFLVKFLILKTFLSSVLIFVSCTEAIADFLALKLKYHNSKIYQKFKPKGVVNLELFDALEETRIITLGSAYMKGIASNLRTRIELFCQKNQFNKIKKKYE